MSSQSGSWGTDADARRTQSTEASGADHPRGAGFRVLSRLARHDADDAYAPRHRLAVPELDGPPDGRDEATDVGGR